MCVLVIMYIYYYHIYNMVSYFDNNATTLIYNTKTKQAIKNWISCANPSNVLHTQGYLAKKEIEMCRYKISKTINTKLPREIYFTSGATESNNIIIQGVIKPNCRIITTSVEHPSIYVLLKKMELIRNIKVTYIIPCIDKSDKQYGTIKIDDIKNAINSSIERIALITIIHGNNETGAINNISKIGKLAKQYNIPFHSDVTQTMGKYKIDVRKCNLDCISFSGHKFHAPKGIGGMYIKDKFKINNLSFGGDQEHGLRPGTENVAFISGMTTALEISHRNRAHKNKLMRNKIICIENNIRNKIVISPSIKYRMPNTLTIILNNMKTDNKRFVQNLSNKYNICLGIGSACKTMSTNISHVFESLGVSDDNISKILRISISDYTTWSECKKLIKYLN
jgi:cysteine desulfurase